MHHGCVHKDKQLIRKKSKGQGLMVSDFIIPCHRLEIASTVLLASILSDRDLEPVPCLKINPRQATEYIKVGNRSW